MEKVFYTARVHTAGGPDGVSRSTDGRLDVQLSPPGSAGSGTNPEQLFAAGWSACFLGALRIAAAQIKIQLPASTAIDAEVDLTEAGGIQGLAVRLRVSIPGIEREVAQELIRAAHATCPYSRATRGNIPVDII
jgi:osmotically inducible protein OsmC